MKEPLREVARCKRKRQAKGKSSSPGMDLIPYGENRGNRDYCLFIRKGIDLLLQTPLLSRA